MFVSPAANETQFKHFATPTRCWSRTRTWAPSFPLPLLARALCNLSGSAALRLMHLLIVHSAASLPLYLSLSLCICLALCTTLYKIAFYPASSTLTPTVLTWTYIRYGKLPRNKIWKRITRFYLLPCLHSHTRSPSLSRTPSCWVCVEKFWPASLCLLVGCFFYFVWTLFLFLLARPTTQLSRAPLEQRANTNPHTHTPTHTGARSRTLAHICVCSRHKGKVVLHLWHFWIYFYTFLLASHISSCVLCPAFSPSLSAPLSVGTFAVLFNSPLRFYNPFSDSVDKAEKANKATSANNTTA